MTYLTINVHYLFLTVDAQVDTKDTNKDLKSKKNTQNHGQERQTKVQSITLTQN